MSTLMADFHPPVVKNLGSGTRRILRGMAEVILPRNDHIQVERCDEVVNYVDNYVLYLPPMLRLGFPLGVWAFQLVSILLTGLPFTWLSLEKRQRYLDGWAHSTLWWRRDLLKGVKALMMMGFFELPEVMRLINYDIETHVAAVKARRLAQYAQDLG